MTTPQEFGFMIRNTLEAIQQLATSLLSSPPASITKASPALKSIVTELGRVVAANKDFRPATVILNNVLMGNIEGYKSGDVTRAEAARAIKAAIKSAEESLYGAVAKIAPAEDKKANPGDVDPAKVGTLMRKYSVIENNIDRQIALRGVYQGEAPILSLIHFNREKLSSLGVPFSDLSGYVVLDRQHVLGVSSKHIDAQILKIEEDGEALLNSDAKGDEKKLKALREVYYDDMVDTFKSRHRGLTLLGNPHSVAGVRFYWFISNSELAILRDASMGKFNANTWSFAFERG